MSTDCCGSVGIQPLAFTHKALHGQCLKAVCSMVMFGIRVICVKAVG